MRALGIVQVYLELDLPETAGEAEVRRELRVAAAVLERLAQEARHRTVEAGLKVGKVQTAVALAPAVERGG